MFDSSSRLVSLVPLYECDSKSWHVLSCDGRRVLRRASAWDCDASLDLFWDFDSLVRYGYTYVSVDVFWDHIEKYYLCDVCAHDFEISFRPVTGVWGETPD